MKYVKRYNKFNLQTKCRICLTQSVGTMINLEAPLKDEMDQKPLVYEALELVMSQNVIISERYPNTVCVMCAELLKIAYDLKIQFQNSQEQLQNWFQELGELSDDPSENNIQNKEECEAPVEIVVGAQKFDIKNLIIVEEDNKESHNFDGFLHNLGTSISASFVEKGYRKPKLNIEPPCLVIQKITPTEHETEVKNINDEIIVEQNEDPAIEEKTETSNIFIETSVDTNIVDKFIVETENDRQVLESALSMKYKCPTCSKPMSSLTKVKIHAQICGKKKKSKCYVCGEQFEARKDLLSHLKNIHVLEINKVKSSKAGRHECHICNQLFSSYGSLAYHMSKHQGRKFNCTVCGKWFFTKNQVDIHMQIHNRDKTIVVCPICGKGFHYQSGLFYHMKMHTNERKYKCNYCPKRFYTRNSIKRHELTHTGARPYDCKYCDKKFRSLGEVKKHQFLHTGERPFQCKYCNMAFIQMHNLKVHLMTHAGEFQCNYCSKGFIEEDILKFHLQNKHQIKQIDQINLNSEEYETALEDEDGLELTEHFETVGNAELMEGQVLEQEYFIMEEDFVTTDDATMSDMIVKTYEIQNEVLVEAVEDPS